MSVLSRRLVRALLGAAILLAWSLSAGSGGWAQQPTEAPAQTAAPPPAAPRGDQPRGNAPRNRDLAPATASAPSPSPPALPTPGPAVTRHQVALADGTTLAYTATVGQLGLADSNNVVKGQFHYIAYTLDGAEAAKRPITFAFNGGPGASSAYLHLGALGPKMLVVNDDATVPPPPATLAANPLTWLAFTDLIFIDPVGTGFSHVAEVDGKPVPTSEFWSVGPDVAWIARFVRQYLNRHQRWASPLFLVGESYGGFRVARLVEVLPTRYFVPVVGAILVSPVIDFDLQRRSDAIVPLSAVMRLPPMAATAWRHGRVAGASADAAARDRFLAEVERFALAELLPALAQGSALPESQRQAIYAREAAMVGLPAARVAALKGRIPREAFIKEVLADSAEVVGRYDAGMTAPDPDPGDRFLEDPDPSWRGQVMALSSAMNQYLRGDLKVTTTRSYTVINGEVESHWNWRGEEKGLPGLPGASGGLRAGLLQNPALKLLIVHGRYDLVTPYFSSVYIARQLTLPEATRANLRVELFEGGHMMYFHREERERLAAMARDFYRSTLSPAQ